MLSKARDSVFRAASKHSAAELQGTDSRLKGVELRSTDLEVGGDLRLALTEVFEGELDPQLSVSGALQDAGLQVGDVVRLTDEVAFVLRGDARVQSREAGVSAAVCTHTDTRELTQTCHGGNDEILPVH